MKLVSQSLSTQSSAITRKETATVLNETDRLCCLGYAAFQEGWLPGWKTSS